jgi:nucleotide-binding universal stress UspA family protein
VLSSLAWVAGEKMNIKNILFATDFSEASQDALKCASEIAHDSGATLYIVHVGHFPAPRVDGSLFGIATCEVTPVPDTWREVRDKLGKVLPTVPGVCYEHRYLEGGPAEEIVDFARRQNVDLIVIGTHGRTGFSHLRLGSIAEAVVRRADCPVLTVKPPVVAPDPALIAEILPAQVL